MPSPSRRAPEQQAQRGFEVPCRGARSPPRAARGGVRRPASSASSAISPSRQPHRERRRRRDRGARQRAAERRGSRAGAKAPARPRCRGPASGRSSANASASRHVVQAHPAPPLLAGAERSARAEQRGRDEFGRAPPGPQHHADARVRDAHAGRRGGRRRAFPLARGSAGSRGRSRSIRPRFRVAAVAVGSIALVETSTRTAEPAAEAIARRPACRGLHAAVHQFALARLRPALVGDPRARSATASSDSSARGSSVPRAGSHATVPGRRPNRARSA